MLHVGGDLLGYLILNYKEVAYEWNCKYTHDHDFCKEKLQEREKGDATKNFW